MECLSCRQRVLAALVRPTKSCNAISQGRLPASTRLLMTRPRGRTASNSVSSRPRRSPSPNTNPIGSISGPSSRDRPFSPRNPTSRKSAHDPVIGTIPIDKHDRSQKTTRPIEEQGVDSRGKKHRHATKRSARQMRRAAQFGNPPSSSNITSPPTTSTTTLLQQKAQEPWAIQKAALAQKLKGESWNPHRRLSPTTIEGIRAMHANSPTQFSTPILAKEFDVSPEEIRRILRSKWKPSAEEAEDRNARWERRGEKIWSAMKEERGYKVPRPWRERGVGREDRGGGREGRERDGYGGDSFGEGFGYGERRERMDRGMRSGGSGGAGGRKGEFRSRDRDSNVPFEGAYGRERIERRPRYGGGEMRSGGRPPRISISETIASALAMSKAQVGSGKGSFAGKIV